MWKNGTPTTKSVSPLLIPLNYYLSPSNTGAEPSVQVGAEPSSHWSFPWRPWPCLPRRPPPLRPETAMTRRTAISVTLNIFKTCCLKIYRYETGLYRLKNYFYMPHEWTTQFNQCVIHDGNSKLRIVIFKIKSDNRNREILSLSVKCLLLKIPKFP